MPKLRFKGFTEDWDQRKLSDIVNLFGGNAFSSDDSINDGAKWLKIANVGIGHIRWNEKSFLPSSYLEDYPAYRLVPGDYVMALTRPILNGELKIAEITEENILLNQRVAKLIFECDKQFGYQLLRKNTTVNCIDNELAGTDPPNLSVSTMSNIKVRIPSENEQKIIGKYLKRLDNLINIHQRKCDELQKVKKYMLQKMFPKKGEKVPEIRFAGFTGDWEQRKFHEVFDGLQNNTLSRADLNYENGEAQDIHYGDILVKFGDYVDAATEELPYIDDKKLVDKFSNSFLQDGDIIIADTAEDETVGKCTEIVGAKGKKLISGLHTIPCRPKQTYAPKFLGYYMNSNAYHAQLRPLMQGIKVTSISKGVLHDTNMVLPNSVDEQERISAYFSQLDNLITLHQRRHDTLKEIKKYMLQNMFPKK